MLFSEIWQQLQQPWSGWQIAAICSIGFLAVVVALLLIIRKKVKEATRAEFGSTLKCPPAFTKYLAGHMQPRPSFLLESDPQSDLRYNRGLINFTPYTASESIRSLSTCQPFAGAAGRADSPDFGYESAQNREWQVSFKVWYKPDKQQFHVTVYRANCTPTPSARFRQLKTSIYIRLSLSNDDRKVFHTNVYANFGTTSIDESFKFDLPAAELESAELRLCLFEIDFDRTPLYEGQTVARLKELTLSCGEAHYLYKDLSLVQKKRPYLAEVLVSLRYEEVLQTLDLKILAVRDTDSSIQEDYNQFYLRLKVMTGPKPMEERTTPLCSSLERATVCAFGLKMSLRAIRNTNIKLALVGITAGGDQRVVGEFAVGRLGSAMRSSAGEHWRMMIENEATPVELWHKLKPIEKSKRNGNNNETKLLLTMSNSSTF